MFKILTCLVSLATCLGASQVRAQEQSVSFSVVINPGTNKGGTSAGKIPDASNVVVWLTPLKRTKVISGHGPLENSAEIVQRHKTFEPHVLVVGAGTMVRFPNKDPFFHNIFSLYDGKRFDLGLYEAGSARSVLFDRSGVSFLFCNIHAEMSAIVVALDTPYFGLSDRAGNVLIRNVPDGRYQMSVWYERTLPESLKELSTMITVSDSAHNFGVLHIPENPDFTTAHKNKYGLDYVPPPSADYDHP
jgi:plastocyanin